MQYVAAEWVESIDGATIIKAIGDDDSVSWIPDVLCSVPPWPEFLESEAGREFLAQMPAPKEGEL